MAIEVSDKPWSDFKESDYTDAQWLRACLLIRPVGSGPAKDRGSCPVREPDGTPNKSAMSAAAAVLGSVGGSGNARGRRMQASDAQMSAAKNKLISLYKSAGLDLPDSLAHNEMTPEEPVPTFDEVVKLIGKDFIEKSLAHHGVLGMRWGVRRPVGSSGLVERSGGGSASSGHPGGGSSSQQKSSADHERATNALAKASTHGRSSLSNEELNALTKRIEAEKKFVQLTSEQKSALQKQVEQMRLEKDYRQLKAEQKMASRSTTRKIIDAILKSASDAAMKQASSYGEQLVKEMLSPTGVKLPKSKSTKANTSEPKSSKKSKSSPPPFRVNPSKVKFTKTSINNLPNLKPTGP